MDAVHTLLTETCGRQSGEGILITHTHTHTRPPTPLGRPPPPPLHLPLLSSVSVSVFSSTSNINKEVMSRSILEKKLVVVFSNNHFPMLFFVSPSLPIKSSGDTPRPCPPALPGGDPGEGGGYLKSVISLQYMVYSRCSTRLVVTNVVRGDLPAERLELLRRLGLRQRAHVPRPEQPLPSPQPLHSLFPPPPLLSTLPGARASHSRADSAASDTNTDTCAPGHLGAVERCPHGDISREAGTTPRRPSKNWTQQDLR